MVKKVDYITKDFLFSKISNYEIFERYLGGFKLNKKFSSPFRSDKNPSCVITESNKGDYYFKDYGTKEFYDGISLVQKMFNLSFQDAINKIAFDFNLSTKSVVAEKQPIIYKHVNKHKKEKFLSIGYRKFTKADLAYWDQYSITEQELKDNDVYSVNNLYVDGIPVPKPEDDLRFAYIIKDSFKEYVKVYTPYSKEWKWQSSSPNTIPFGFFNLKKGDLLVITKSAKDMIVLKKFYQNVIALQSEDITSLTDKTKEWINKHYKKVLILLDNDKQGIKSLIEYNEQLGWQTHHYPEYYREDFGVKDSADFVKLWGTQALRLYLKQNNLL
jgi:hypothetical protein